MKGLDELRLSSYHFWYGENVHLDYISNTLHYRMCVMNESHCINQPGGLPNTRICFANESLPDGDAIYDKVVIVPYRRQYMLFHGMEAVNTLVRFLITYGDEFPVRLCRATHI